ncbi:phosphatidylethanolamine N-methyltransferase [Coemansia sp. RSA 552]|nr:phosphatidylethanolamine N-methyltransferase [Coemansia sp. RSA 552]
MGEKDSKSNEVLAGCMGEAPEPLVGRTTDGKAFAVPRTRDLVQSLFNPVTPKTTFDIVTLATLGAQAAVAMALPLGARRAVQLAAFAFWRLSYNGGLGWLLRWQSQRRGVVGLVRRRGWLDAERGGRAYEWLRHELGAKMGADYEFERVPLEFNAWLLFRQLVDMVLVNDFVAYLLLCSSYLGSARDAEGWHTVLRVAGGAALLAFNVWVKMDAHRVVKDYAWYWGDFFFLVEQALTFDGVFEMAPHPMYSIGYAGYYGGALITGSYTVFYAGLAAHALQFLFLALVENPHIEKTYERPPLAVQVIQRSRERSRTRSAQPATIRERPAGLWHPDLIVFRNFDLLRAPDALIVFLVGYAVGVPLCAAASLGAGRTQLQLYACVQCVFWIAFRTLGLGVLLRAQSTRQAVTRWFIRRGGDSDEAFASWRALYNAATILTYASFALVGLSTYGWGGADAGTLVLRHTLGALLVGLHVWSARSVYETLGDFGWFYGDFFARDASVLALAPPDLKLYYTGIYRYLNNPDRVIGQAAFYGLALIARSRAVFALALLLQACTFVFSAYVEAPHMAKVYGAQVRRDSGIVRTLKRAVNKSMGQTLFSEPQPELGPSPEPQPEPKAPGLLASTTRPVKDILAETRDLLATTTARLAEKTLPPELARLDCAADYAISARTAYLLGEPIRAAWQAPPGHSRRDWVGVYPVTANVSPQVTTASSRGRFVYIHPDADLLAEMAVGDCCYAGAVRRRARVLQGDALFSADALPFRVGSYELRLHHAGTHAVLARSAPFEIAACPAADAAHVLGRAAPPGPDASLDLDRLALALLAVANKALTVTDSRTVQVDGDVVVQTDLVEPLESVADLLSVAGLLPEPQARRLGYAIKEYFSVDFAADVLVHAAKHGATIRDVAKRIQEARQALSAYSSGCIKP